MSTNTPTASSKDKVRALLRSRKWYTSTEINNVAGTPSGTRRAREMRQDGYTVKTRRINGKTEYRVSDGPTR